MAEINKSEKLFKRARELMAGGVNSPVRSFKAVGGLPVFIKSGSGSKLYSEDGKEYIDFCLSWGALILGHAFPKVTAALADAAGRGTSFGAPTAGENEIASLITRAVDSIERLRMTSSGTEAVMGALRLARGYTKKNIVIKFEGAYHGHADYLLSEAGSGAASLGIPASAGVPEDFVKNTLTLPFNDVEKVTESVKRYQDDLAAVIVEPVMANCGVILPEEAFLKELRSLADSYGFVLVFDEVITGFRFVFGGAGKYCGVEPDLTCLGKIIGGGLPAGAFGGRRRIMDKLAPRGDVYQAGTLSGNPLSVAAGICVLKELKKNDPYLSLEKRGGFFEDKIKASAAEAGLPFKVNRKGSMMSCFFSEGEVRNYSDARNQDTELFSKFYHGLLERGVYFSPSPFETDFISAAHSDYDIQCAAYAAREALKSI